MSGPRHTTHADIERELGGAEALLHRTRQRRRSLSVATLALAVVDVLAFTAAFALVRGQHKALPLTIGAGGGAFALLAVGLLVISRLRKGVVGQEQQMVKAVNWVREVFPLVAEREGWIRAQAEAVREPVAKFPVVAR